MQLTFENKTIDQLAIELIQAYATDDPYYLGFSGGKDSVVIYDLTKRAGVNFDAHYCVSPIDPPNIREFIKEYYPEVIWDYHARGFWKQYLIEGPPMRSARWCCELIKEAGGIGRVKVLGMRKAESNTRKDYKCFMPGKYADTAWLLPIVSWRDSDVWQYLYEKSLMVCSLYKQGYTRLGCVLCPFESASTTKINIQRFPRIALAWRLASDRYFDKRIERGTPLPYETKDEFWNWWISRK